MFEKIDEEFLKTLVTDVPYSSEEKKERVLKKLSMLEYKLSSVLSEEINKYFMVELINHFKTSIIVDNMSINKSGILLLNKCDQELSKNYSDMSKKNKYLNLMAIVNDIMDDITDSLRESDGNK
jgi:DNA primase large subunit